MLSGNVDGVFAAVGRAFATVADGGQVVLVLKASNACASGGAMEGMVAARDAGKIGLERPRRIGDPRRRIGRNDPQPPLNPRQPRLHIQHRAQAGGIGEARGDVRVGEQRPVEGGIDGRNSHGATITRLNRKVTPDAR